MLEICKIQLFIMVTFVVTLVVTHLVTQQNLCIHEKMYKSLNLLLNLLKKIFNKSDHPLSTLFSMGWSLLLKIKNKLWCKFKYLQNEFKRGRGVCNKWKEKKNSSSRLRNLDLMRSLENILPLTYWRVAWN